MRKCLGVKPHTRVFLLLRLSLPPSEQRTPTEQDLPVLLGELSALLRITEATAEAEGVCWTSALPWVTCCSERGVGGGSPRGSAPPHWELRVAAEPLHIHALWLILIFKYSLIKLNYASVSVSLSSLQLLLPPPTPTLKVRASFLWLCRYVYVCTNI